MRRFVVASILALGAIAPVSAQQPPAAQPAPPKTPEVQALEMLRAQALDREKSISEAAFQLKTTSEAQAKQLEADKTQIEDLQKQLEAAKAAAPAKVANTDAPK